MKILINNIQQAILNLTMLFKLIDMRTPMSNVKDCILVEAIPGITKIMATDGLTGLIYTPQAEIAVTESGRVILDPRKLNNLLKSEKASGKCDFDDVSNYFGDVFPDVPITTAPRGIINGDTLKDVYPFASEDRHKIYAYVLLDYRNSTVIGTDRYRLALNKIVSPATELCTTIPRKTAEILATVGGNFMIYIQDAYVIFKNSSFTVICKPHNNGYPDYHDVINRETEAINSVTVNRKDFVNAIRRVREKIRFDVSVYARSSSQIAIYCKHTELLETLDCDFRGNLPAGIDIGHINILSTIKRINTPSVTVKFSRSRQPAFIYDAMDNLKYIVTTSITSSGKYGYTSCPDDIHPILTTSSTNNN
ncbi:MAG: hypothetical protein ACYC69_16475 [Thermodesulfovibrionales bacterium]